MAFGTHRPRKLTPLEEKQKAARERYEATMRPYRKAVDDARKLLQHSTHLMKMAHRRAADVERQMLLDAMAEAKQNGEKLRPTRKS